MSPGFTPRPSLSVHDRLRPRAAGYQVVSPGFTPRPSLSAREHQARPALDAGVAGVHAPAFVERWARTPSRRRTGGVAGVHAPAFVERGRRRPGCRFRVMRVSPGFTPRPSLSEHRGRPLPDGVAVSPGFTPRPSLSGRPRLPGQRPTARVAGVHAPAFVERGMTGHAGPPTWPDRVSPGFTPRPSLSGVQSPRHHGPESGCRRGSRPGLR